MKELQRNENIEIELCMGTACHVHGAADLLHRLEMLGNTYSINVSGTPCLGSCRESGALRPPVIRINDRLHFGVLPDGLEKLIAAVLEDDKEAQR